MQPKYVLTLVHGTFARKARWPLPGSEFTKALSDALDGPTKVYALPWSGRNTVSAREIAAVQLRKDLEARLRAFPDAHHFVIAHSHAGNIAIRAISSGLSHRIAGVVCLSTPFIDVVRRTWRKEAVGAVAFTIAFATAAASWIIAGLSWPPPKEAVPPLALFAALIFGIVVF